MDTGSGRNGVATVNVAKGGTAVELALGAVVAASGKVVVAGPVDLVANGFTPDGALGTSFGSNGPARVDVAGEDDRGRNLVALPDGRTVLVGSGKPGGSNVDAMVVRLTTAGALDPGYGQGGRKLFDVGGPNDSFFGVALSPDGTRLAAVGYLGRDTSGREKDDSAVLWLQP